MDWAASPVIIKRGKPRLRLISTSTTNASKPSKLAPAKQIQEFFIRSSGKYGFDSFTWGL
ncbi:hypothetical protein [Leptospira borgpetersenii]|uniref:hypothetical protein n=1 Tax=Leptospira borgpetersenii TaxID=174 RepID=UPI0027DCF437|nr:hypothetical protein [Leptospira borgpetersenii]